MSVQLLNLPKTPDEETLRTITQEQLPIEVYKMAAPYMKVIKDFVVFGGDKERLPTELRAMEPEYWEVIEKGVYEFLVYNEYEKFFKDYGCDPKNPATEKSILVVYQHNYPDRPLTKVVNHPRNIYYFAQYEGVQFSDLDTMAPKMGVQRKDDSRRVAGAIVYAMVTRMGWGDTVFKTNTIRHAAYKILAASKRFDPIPTNEKGMLPMDLFKAAAKKLESFYPSRSFVFNRKTTSVQYNPLYWGEYHLAKEVCRMGSAAPAISLDKGKALETIEQKFPYLDAVQRDGILAVLDNSFVIWTGGAGVGKSTTIRALVEVLATQKLTNIAVVASTGIAAENLELGADTIYALLRINPVTEKPFFTSDAPLDYDAVIADEFSMADVLLAEKLVKAMKHGARLLIVGDPFQLSSVLPGQVLYDLTHGLRGKGIPGPVWVELKHRYRNDNTIAELAETLLPENDVQTQFLPILQKGVEQGDVKHIRFDNAADLKQHLVEVLAFQPDAMVVSPTYETNTGLGVNALNDLIRDVTNPGKRTVWGFRKGDRVLQITPDRLNGIRNGEAGTCTRAVKKPGLGSIVEVCFDSGKVAMHHNGTISINWRLGYVSTVHKNQGRQADTVVCVITDKWAKPLLYTAMTRAKKSLILLEMGNNLATGLNKGYIPRLTNLVRRYESARAKTEV